MSNVWQAIKTRWFSTYLETAITITNMSLLGIRECVAWAWITCIDDPEIRKRQEQKELSDQILLAPVHTSKYLSTTVYSLYFLISPFIIVVSMSTFCYYRRCDSKRCWENWSARIIQATVHLVYVNRRTLAFSLNMFRNMRLLRYCRCRENYNGFAVTTLFGV